VRWEMKPSLDDA